MAYGPPGYQQPPPPYGPPAQPPVYSPPPPMYGPPPPPGYGPQPMYMQPAPMMEPVPGWWWLLPIFLSIIGGLIAYFVWKDRNPPTARNMLLLGIVMMVVGFVVSFASPSCCYFFY